MLVYTYSLHVLEAEAGGPGVKIIISYTASLRPPWTLPQTMDVEVLGLVVHTCSPRLEGRSRRLAINLRQAWSMK